MADGIFLVNDTGLRYRPQSKKAIKERLAENPERVMLEHTSIRDDRGSEPVTELAPGTYFFTGPDPYTARKFYGQVIVGAKGVQIK